MNRSLPIKLNVLPLVQRAAKNRGLIFGGIILTALLAFEVFNYSSTSFALQDILGNLAFGSLKWSTMLLRRARRLFPTSGIIGNNLGLAFSRVGMTDSAAFYFNDALNDSRAAHSARLNQLALLAKSTQRVNMDSVHQVLAEGSAAVRSKALALANHEGRLFAEVPVLPKDSLLDLFSASLLANYLTNQTNQADSSFVNACVAIARKEENLPFRHMILPSAAKAS